jgi:hypothetical protein
MVEKVKCKTKGCTNEGIAIPPSRARLSEDGKGRSICGSCGEVMVIQETSSPSGHKGGRGGGRPNRR